MARRDRRQYSTRNALAALAGGVPVYRGSREVRRRCQHWPHGGERRSDRCRGRCGATLSTHLGNAAPGLMPKFPNCLWDQLAEDRLSASFIADGIHLDDAFLRVALRAKGVEVRSSLRTPPLPRAPRGALPAGRTRCRSHGGQPGGPRRNPKTRGIRSAYESRHREHCSHRRSSPDALRAATINPARLIRLEGRTKGLETGERGDVVIFRKNPEIAIEAVYLDGTRVA